MVFSTVLAAFFLAFTQVNAQSVTATSSNSSSVSGTLTAPLTSGTSLASGLSASSTSTASYPSLSGYSACVSDCLQTSVAAAQCESIILVDCYCNKTNSADFTSSLMSCVTQNCASELNSAEGLAQQFCAVANGSVTLSFPTTVSSSSTSKSGSASTTLPPTTSSGQPSSSNNAAVGSGPFILDSKLVMGGMITLLSAMFGALCL